MEHIAIHRLPLAPGFTLPSVRYLNHTGAKGFFGDKMLCSKCLMLASRNKGTEMRPYWLCSRHYRISQMRSEAKKRGKRIPSYDNLEAMIDDLGPEMICIGCDRKMLWFRRSGDPSRTISLQHNRDGTMSLICVSCNTRHHSYPGDSFYDRDKSLRRCGKCEKELPLDNFYPSKGRGHWRDRVSFCKSCRHVIYLESKMRESI